VKNRRRAVVSSVNWAHEQRDGPDAHLSFGNPVNGGQDFHFDNRYPYGSIGGFFDHTAGVIQTFGNFLTGQHGPPPQDIRPSASVPQ
jgi:hypothetical protein